MGRSVKEANIYRTTEIMALSWDVLGATDFYL